MNRQSARLARLLGRKCTDLDIRLKGNPGFVYALACPYNILGNFGGPEIDHAGWYLGLVDVTGLPCRVSCHLSGSLIHIGHRDSRYLSNLTA